MERSLHKLNNIQLAEKLTTELTGNYNYLVTDDIQLFSNDMRIEDETYIPTLLKVMTIFQDPNKYARTEVYSLTFRVNKNLSKDSFYNDMDTFKSSQTDELIDSEYVTKIYQKIKYVGDDVLEGQEYWMYELEFTWIYSLALVGSQSVIKVDTVEIPFIELDIVHDKAYISNQTSGSSYRMTNDTILLTVPLILTNTKIGTLFNYINSDNYNTEFVLDINGVEKTVVLKRGQIRYMKTGLITNMILTLETAYPRVTFTLDGEIVPNSAWRLEMKATIETHKRVGDKMYGYASGKTRSWSVTLVKDSSTVYAKVVDDLLDDTLNQTYELVRDTDTFTVILGQVIEEYSETGDMTLQCQFIEYE
jgi:hypothetical protein